MQGDHVILLHGILRSHRQMKELATYLETKGFVVLNLDYPSTQQPLENLVDIVWQEVQENIPQDILTHFVGYSMGGLLTRALLSKYRPTQLGRVVQLATPNQGSEVADFLKENWLFQQVYGPAGQQLITDQSKFSHLFSPIDYECGVIAGNFSIDPISSFIIGGNILSKNDDGKVAVQRTKVEGMRDHIIVDTSHLWFPYSKEVHRQTAHFLTYGEFLKK